MPDKSVAYGLVYRLYLSNAWQNKLSRYKLSIAIRAIIFDVSLYGLVRRLKTSPAFRLVNDKFIDAAVYIDKIPLHLEFMSSKTSLIFYFIFRAGFLKPALILAPRVFYS